MKGHLNSLGLLRAIILLLFGLCAMPAKAVDLMPLVNCTMYSERPADVSYAIQQCNRALELGGLAKANLVKAYQGRALAWSHVGQYGRAVEDASAAIKLFPKDAMRYTIRGNYKKSAGDLDGALADFDQAIKVNPRSSEAYVARSYLWDEKGVTRSALVDLDRAVEIDPANAEAFNSRCYLTLKVSGDLKRALADCNSAVTMKSDFSAALTNRCGVKLALGDPAGAIADCTAALQRDNNQISPLVRRGEALELSGKSERAGSDYEAALVLKPDGKEDIAALAHAKERLAYLAERRAIQVAVVPVAKSATEVQTPAKGQPPATAALTPSGGSDQIVATPPSNRIALVIGNSSYRNVPALANPVRDADVVAQQLKLAGFRSVTLTKDLARNDMLEALRKFSADTENAEWAVIYYAGHGMEMDGLNYLIPVDAKLASDRAVQFEAIPLEQAMGAVEGARKLRLVILDACRDNPFAQQMKRTVSSRSIGRGMGNVEPDAGTLVVYSAKHGQVALDGDGGNSPFVSALVKRMMTPNLDVRRLFDYVRDDVLATTQRRQQPFSYGSLPGSEDFFFLTK